MSAKDVIGVPAFDFRLKDLEQRTATETCALMIGVSHSGAATEVARGRRPEMRNLRNQLVCDLRSNPKTLEILASAIASLVRDIERRQPVGECVDGSPAFAADAPSF